LLDNAAVRSACGRNGVMTCRVESAGSGAGRFGNARGTTVDKQTKHEILVVTLATLSPLPLLMGVVALVLH